MNNKFQKEIDILVKNKEFNKISDSLSPKDQMLVRQSALEKITGTNFKNIKYPLFDINNVSLKNCENLLGKVEIPLGIAGPLKINGECFKGETFVPLATTEGALVASVNRGCKVINASGGVNTFTEQVGTSRGPVFRTKDINESKKFVLWLKEHYGDIESKIKLLDPYLSLLSITPHLVGRNVFLRFVFNTGDAMGMNMVTIACDRVIEDYIEKETGVDCIALSGNVCTDKKPSWMNKIEKRGRSVHADIVVPENVVKNVLKTTSEKIVEVNYRKNLLGSALSGSLGFNAHHANIVAAMFIATGQDPAHVVEGSIGTTTAEAVGKDLYFSVSLPALLLGTVGGGTSLATQKEVLSIMGVYGGGSPSGTNANKLAEIVASSVLAGEISLLGALSSRDLSKAHRRLGRGEKV